MKITFSTCVQISSAFSSRSIVSHNNNHNNNNNNQNLDTWMLVCFGWMKIKSHSTVRFLTWDSNGWMQVQAPFFFRFVCFLQLKFHPFNQVMILDRLQLSFNRFYSEIINFFFRFDKKNKYIYIYIWLPCSFP